MSNKNSAKTSTAKRKPVVLMSMGAQERNVEVISNNIANMNTVGFKKQRAEFQDLLYQNIERMGAQSSNQGTVVPTGIECGSNGLTDSGATPASAGIATW